MTILCDCEIFVEGWFEALSAAQIVMFCFVVPSRGILTTTNSGAAANSAIKQHHNVAVDISRAIMSTLSTATATTAQQQSTSTHPSMSAPLSSHFNINWFSQANNYRRQSVRSLYLCAG